MSAKGLKKNKGDLSPFAIPGERSESKDLARRQPLTSPYTLPTGGGVDRILSRVAVRSAEPDGVAVHPKRRKPCQKRADA